MRHKTNLCSSYNVFVSASCWKCLVFDKCNISYVERSTHSFFLVPTSSNDCKLIVLVPKVTYYGTISIPVRIFKRISDLICIPLSNWINDWFTCVFFLDSLKVVSVIPIIKIGDIKLVSNYRLISILPLISKVFKDFMRKRLLNFFTFFNVLSHQQFGFQWDKSYADAVG